MKNEQLKKFLTLKEVAAYLNMSEGYVRKLAKDKIGYYRFGSKIYVDKNDLDRWIAAQKKQPKAKLSLKDWINLPPSTF